MATMSHPHDHRTLGVIHPLYDVPERKCSASGLDKIAMSPSVRISLFVLRGYLILISGLCLYHVIGLAHLLSAGK